MSERMNDKSSVVRIVNIEPLATDDSSLHSTDGSPCICNPTIERHDDVLHYIHKDLSKTENQQ